MVPVPSLRVADALEVLERTPAVLAGLLAGISDGWASANEGDQTFSPFDVVGHLIDGEETDWLPRARIILARREPRRFAPYDRFRHRTRNADRSLPSLLDEFATLRRRNLREVRGWELGPEELALRGVHPDFGEVTLAQLVATWTVHDLGHIAQATRVMAKRYGELVGPWAAYLPILRDRSAPTGK